MTEKRERTSSPAAGGKVGLGWTAGRVLAGFFGGFALLNLLGDMAAAGFDANIWWIDFRPLPPDYTSAILLAAGLALSAYAIRPEMVGWRRHLTPWLVLVLLLAAAWNILTFYRLLSGGVVATAVPVPLSVFTAGAMGLVLWTMRHPPPSDRKPRRLAAMMMLGALLVGFPMAQMYCFGKTDYRRRADVIVVFGAAVYANGRCSDALADRMRTACQLYKDGYAPRIILSGGPGYGEIHETEGMRRMALGLGVPQDALVIDAAGVNTHATVRNLVGWLDRLGAKRALAVSHFYHLPRIKMASQRQGLDVYTVPAKESYRLRAMPWYIAREVAALWLYYLRPLAGETP